MNTTALWHASGTKGDTYDNWTGTLTYTGATVAPKYQLTPTGVQAITGSLFAWTALAQNRRLTARWHKTLSAIISPVH